MAQTVSKQDYVQNKIQKTKIASRGVPEVLDRFVRYANKRTGEQQKFKRYPEEELHFLKSAFVKENKDRRKHRETNVSEFELDKLELEYDYETDED